jgi:hypothetical protein
LKKNLCSPFIFNFVFGPNGFGSPFFSPLIFPRRHSCSRPLGPASQPSPTQLTSTSSSSFQAAACHRPKSRRPTHLRPPAHLPRPSTPPETALPPHPLSSPSIFPSPISSPTKNGAINSRRPSSHPDRLRYLTLTLYKGPSGTAAHNRPLCCPLFHSFVPPSAAPPSSSRRHHLAPPPASLHHRTTCQRPR